MALLTWDIRQQRKVIPKKQETKELQLTAGRKFLAYGAGRGNKAEARIVPKLKRWTWVSMEPKALGIHRKAFWRGENCTEKEFWRSADNLCEYSAES